jgi:hypothetical protein
VFPSPTSYMLISFSFPHQPKIYSLDSPQMICNLPENLEFELTASQTQLANL